MREYKKLLIFFVECARLVYFLLLNKNRKYLAPLDGLQSVPAILGGISSFIFIGLLSCLVSSKYWSRNNSNSNETYDNHEINAEDDFDDVIQAAAPPSYNIGTLANKQNWKLVQWKSLPMIKLQLEVSSSSNFFRIVCWMSRKILESLENLSTFCVSLLCNISLKEQLTLFSLSVFYLFQYLTSFKSISFIGHQNVYTCFGNQNKISGWYHHFSWKSGNCQGNIPGVGFFNDIFYSPKAWICLVSAIKLLYVLNIPFMFNK